MASLGLLASVLLMVLGSPLGASSLATVSLLDHGSWSLLVLLAALGAVLGARPILARVRRRGPCREQPARGSWASALTLPLLVATLAFPFVTPALWSGPALHVAAALLAALASLWLIVRVVRGLSSVRWTRPELHGEGLLASTRPRRARHIEHIWQRMHDSLRGRIALERPPVLCAAGDRDMHLALRLGDLSVRVYDGLVQLVVHTGWIPEATLERVRETSGLELHASPGAALALLAEPWQLDALGRAAAELVLDHEPALVPSPWPLAGSAPAPSALEQPRTFLALEPGSDAPVTWTLTADHRLVVEDASGAATIDLGRRFALHLAHAPVNHGEEPWLGLVVRQRDDDGVEGPVRGRWTELRLRVALRARVDALAEALPRQAVVAPALARPREFAVLWRRLYWAAREHGARPYALPGLPLGADRDVAPVPLERVAQRHWKLAPSRLERVLPWSTAALVLATTVVGLSALSDAVLVYPYRTHGAWTPLLLMALPALLLVASGFVLRASMTRYLRAATVELLDVLAHCCGLDVWRARLALPRVRGSVHRFSERGERAVVTLELEHGLSARLRVWPGGLRAGGLCMVEQLELRARPLAGARRDYRVLLGALHERIAARDGQSVLREDGGERVLTLQTRRLVGSGAGVWSALAGLVAPGLRGPSLTPLPEAAPEAHAALVDALGRLEAPTWPLPSQARLRHVLARSPRGLRHALAIAGVTCSLLAMPQLDTQGWPVAPSGQEPVRLHACPHGAASSGQPAEARCARDAERVLAEARAAREGARGAAQRQHPRGARPAARPLAPGGS